MDLHYLCCKIGEQIEALSALQAEVHHAEKLADEQKPTTNSARDAIAAWENHCKWHLKMNGPGCGIENDGKCKHWFIMGYNAATAPVA